jgi:hypothetical protein
MRGNAKWLSMKLIVILSIKKKDFFKYRTDVEKKEQLKEIWRLL